MKSKVTAIMSAVLLLHCMTLNAQWSLTGNTNATASSRLGTNNNIPLRLFTNNAQQMHINANVSGKVGFVGIGTTAPNTRLHVNGVITAQGGTSTNWNTAYTRIASAFSNNRIPRWNGSAFVNGAMVDNGNSVGVGVTSIPARLAVANRSLNGIASEGAFQIGASNTLNVVMDDNELQARSNGVASTLYLNNSGGNISFSAGGGSGIFGGNVGIGIAPATRLHIKQNLPNRAIQWEHESLSDYWTLGIGTNTHNGRFEYNGFIRGQISSVDGAYMQGSDERLKTEVESLSASLEKIMALTPSKYYYTSSRSFAKKKSMGFIAQEVEELFPELVYDSDEGYKCLNYSGFSVIAIKGLQELNTELNEVINRQQEQINELLENFKALENAVAQCCINYESTKNKSVLSPDDMDKPFLEQNTPNPFVEETVIKYYLPLKSKGVIKVMSLEGQLIIEKQITGSGYGEVIISANSMAAGTYTYSLLVNDKAVESKIMILTR